MENQLPVLKVQMFGKEKITYGDNPVFSGKNIVTKSMKLMFILLHCGDKGIARKELLESLFGGEELANVGNSLRVAMHRLKKQLVDSGLPEYEYIISKKGSYYWDSPMKTEVDIVLFEQLIEKAAQESDENRIEFLKQAVDLYKGEFLQKLSDDDGLLRERIRYKELYFVALRQLCEYLMAQKKYNDVLKYVEPACEMYPFDEWQSIKIDCYIAMNLYKEAMKEYDDTAKLLIEELGVTPSERMMDQFDEMSKRITNRPQNIIEIKSALQEEADISGAYFCTVPGFRDLYRVTRRSMERNGQSVFLLVCTLTDSQGYPMENSKKLDEMAEALYYVLKGSIRKSDFFTKYNSSQYLILLPGTNKDTCQIVIDRISRNYSNLHRTWAKHLQCSMSSLMDGR